MDNDYNDVYYNQIYDEKSAESMQRCFYSLICIILVFLALLLFSSCKSIQYVPVETVRTEYKNHTDTVEKTDTVVNEKETIIREADSTLVAELGLKLKANERAILILRKELEKKTSTERESKTDTVIKTDTIQIPYPVEKKLTKWEQTKMDAGGIAIGVCIAVIVMIFISFVVKAYRKT